jgi:hypothetical protein
MTQSLPPPHSRRPPEIWAAARADYEAGASAAVVAERYAIPLRTVRRHALAEDWRREDGPDVYARQLRRLRHDLGGRPELAAIEDLNSEDSYELLFVPNSMGLAGFAFRRAAESAALGGPAESAAWLRVAHLAERLGNRHDVGQDPFRVADQLWAEMMRAPAGADDETVDDDPHVAEVADLADEKRGHFAFDD